MQNFEKDSVGWHVGLVYTTAGMEKESGIVCMCTLSTKMKKKKMAVIIL